MIEAHYNIAYLHIERGEYTTALPYLKEVVTMNPNDSEAYYLMGICCIQSKMEKEAEIFFCRVSSVETGTYTSGHKSL